ncbi:Heat shock protein HSP70 [Ceratobasidium theobromae]|uniref:Heat shock protein HSP70 n=1 Tax=Ceratobasidium theobromae TaxID=1582974 RepID=A0A5N5QNI9_9AGAM|nr:Heat shock protein HSP70 [Ceratobasidium theobromae]
MASLRGSSAIDAAPKPFRGPWEGESKIVIGIDIGTTQSGVAFSYLQKDASQTVLRVTRWPGQEAHSQRGKIPTVVWYDTNMKAVSFGAEALSYQAEEEAADNGWFLAKYFKLHLHPEDMKAKHDLKLDDLPPGVPLRQIYSDFLGYLLKHTQLYFEDRILDGKQIWEKYKPTMEVIIAHPNGWGIREQTFLRTAAVEAGFADPDKASSRIRFVTEAEASVHYCIHHTNLGNQLKPGTNFGVCDAGGSTVDTTLYSVVSAQPVLKLEEKRASACKSLYPVWCDRSSFSEATGVQAGAIFVDFEAEKYLRRTLSGAGLPPEDVDDYTKAGIKQFEAFAKRIFQDETVEDSVTIAHSRFNNTSIRTRRGRMTLSGSTLKSFFDACLKEIVSSVDQQLEGLTVPYVLLVGGFGDSPYIRKEFKKRYEPKGCQITLTNDATAKAVAEGAVIWSIANSVCSRAPRYSFGVVCSLPFYPWLPDHQGRQTHVAVNGQRVIRGAWSQIVKKGIALDSEAVCREAFISIRGNAARHMGYMSMDLLAYSGDDTPTWALDRSGKSDKLI